MSAIENARAVLDSQITFPDSPIRLHNHGGYVQAMSAYECSLHDALRALIAEHEKVRHALTTLAEGGLGFDLNPTMRMEAMDSVYAQWAEYAERMDASVRKYARISLSDGDQS